MPQISEIGAFEHRERSVGYLVEISAQSASERRRLPESASRSFMSPNQHVIAMPKISCVHLAPHKWNRRPHSWRLTYTAAPVTGIGLPCMRPRRARAPLTSREARKWGIPGALARVLLPGNACCGSSDKHEVISYNSFHAALKHKHLEVIIERKRSRRKQSLAFKSQSMGVIKRVACLIGPWSWSMGIIIIRITRWPAAIAPSMRASYLPFGTARHRAITAERTIRERALRAISRFEKSVKSSIAAINIAAAHQQS